MEWSLVVLPDTQIYADRYPKHLDHQVDFVLRHAESNHVAAVLHEGDVTNDNSDAQWERAAHALRRLQGQVPLVMALGNHDYGEKGSGGDRTTRFHRWFPFDSFTSVRAAFERERADNALHVVSTPEGSWHVLALEFGPRDEVVAWAKEQLDAHPSTPTIVLTHAYLYSDHTRYDRRRDDQRWAPQLYGVARTQSVNEGQELYEKLIAPCPQVRFVLCGHVLNEGTGLRTDSRPDGTRVHQILANYQTRSEGGESYLRLMTFTEGEVRIRTYSPALDCELDDARNHFDVVR